ncbi:hypothetical protein HYZ82_01815 [Candidatus Nomurabacteria bacterium]|nr:hypothetical protein [Candidatus Nomurabacteria bacterium]
MLPENIIFLGLAISLIGIFFYVRSILRGHAKPNLVSWFIWTLAPFIGVFFQLKAGANLSVLPVFMAGLGPCVIILVAFLTKNAIWKINKFDLACGAVSLISLAIYVLTHNLAISVLFAILSDLLAFIPTFVKGWKFPETEHHSAYSYPILSNLVGLLVIKEWTFTIYSFGLYFLIANLTMILILYRKRIYEKLYT